MKKKLLGCFKVVMSFAIACSLGMLSVSNASATSQSQLQKVNEQVFTIDGKKYTASVEDMADKRESVVKDESGKSVSAVLDKKTGKITIDGRELKVEYSENDLADSGSTNKKLLASAKSKAKSKNKVLSRKTYTIPGYMTLAASTALAALSVVAVYPAAVTAVSHLFAVGCAGKPIKVTITEYRTASKYKSGQHKGRYKYWTNVLIKCGKITLLNINDSIMYDS